MTDFFISLQCGTCLVWLFLILVRSNKTLAQKVLAPIMLMSFAIFFGDLYFAFPGANNYTLVWIDIMSQFVGPSLAPLILVFVFARYNIRIKREWWLMWLALPVGLGLTSALLYGMMGMDASAELMSHGNHFGLSLPDKYDSALYKTHLFIERILFFVLVSLQMLSVLGFLVWRLMKDRLTFKKLGLFANKHIKLKTDSVIVLLLIPLLICVITRCAIGTTYYNTAFAKVILPLLITLLITVICNIALNVKGERVRIDMLGGDTISAHTRTAQDLTIDKEVGLNVALPQGAEPDNAAGINMNPEEYSALLKKFNHELVTKKGFLDEDITLNKLVGSLGYNRTYLSYLVNREYGIPFRDVVGQLRIDHAMKYMKEHPDCLQETVAAECGFTSAPAFNRKFTQVVGMTPRLWYQRNLKPQENEAEED